jgi:hypothetical protein
LIGQGERENIEKGIPENKGRLTNSNDSLFIEYIFKNWYYKFKRLIQKYCWKRIFTEEKINGKRLIMIVLDLIGKTPFKQGYIWNFILLNQIIYNFLEDGNFN